MKQPEAASPKTIRLQDYQPTNYKIEQIDLHFDLEEEKTQVRSTLTITRRDTVATNAPLVLHGEDLVLKSVAIDGTVLEESGYQLDGETLTLSGLPESFVLEIENEINPAANTSLNGLYTSGGNFCTQCEAEGFRRITYMYDRPDVMARYSTTIVADKSKYPVLLSNGNMVDSGLVSKSDDEQSQRHWARWEDPFPKPTYLFALVAGDLTRVEDSFTTMSGREVALHIFVQHHNADKCSYAMRSLKKSMEWDEKVYGREYDLDVYMIVAVDDFNMGAMENKGLNVFNSKYVLAKPETATDSDYQGIEGVIGHEYFHNWSGNRVTCRDWFQLSLKEGFTVFRDQEFSADMTSRGVKRIQDVNILRAHQFREDSGPMAHPVRPESYVEINNFYTVTIYNKGAEVVRMLHHLLGAESFRKGTDLYFDRHDGQAVTTDDFVRALEDANDVDLKQFRRWYSQAGTPKLTVQRQYDADNNTYTLTIEQSCPATPGQEDKQPFYIPLAYGLLDEAGNDTDAGVLHIKEKKQEFVFNNIEAEPVPSLLRGFSAPVKVDLDLSDSELAFLMAHDSDDFNRWEAGQRFAIGIIKRLVMDYQQDRQLTMNEAYLNAIEKILDNDSLDKSLAAQALSLPSQAYISEFIEPIDPLAIHHVCLFLRLEIASALQEKLLLVYNSNLDSGPYRVDQQAMGQRSLKNCCLGYLMELNTPEIRELCLKQFEMGNNMTDVIAALNMFANTDCDERMQALDRFYHQWKDDALVTDKWLSIQASSRLPNTLERVKELTSHEVFNIRNPNKVRSLIGVFAQANAVNFHDASGDGYRFAADHVLTLDELNPQISARLVSVFTMWRKYDEQRQALMKAELERIAAKEGLSKDVYEIVSKSLM